MSSADLEALVRQGPHAADELPKMLAALGIDQQDLARTEPLVLRDMERVCSLCNHKRQCDRDLAAGTAAAHYEEYCGNADTIDGLGPRVRSRTCAGVAENGAFHLAAHLDRAAALAVLLFVRLHNANGAPLPQTAPRPGIVSPKPGARIVTRSRPRPRREGRGPDFVAIANRPRPRRCR